MAHFFYWNVLNPTRIALFGRGRTQFIIDIFYPKGVDGPGIHAMEYLPMSDFIALRGDRRCTLFISLSFMLQTVYYDLLPSLHFPGLIEGQRLGIGLSFFRRGSEQFHPQTKTRMHC